MKYIIALLLIVLSISSRTQCNPDDLLSEQVRASDTDDDISFELFKHYTYYNPSCDANNILLVHLVGSFDNPVSTQYFPTVAANNGFHVVSLKYENNIAAQTACGESNDADCYYKFRKEIIEGVDLSEEVEVNVANSINNRLLKLLQYMDANTTGQNWSNYYNDGDINWSNIIISGHSQGGGHAALIAKEKNVKRALMFASPNDYSEFYEEPAPWTINDSSTPDSLYYGFNNTADNVVDFEDQMEAWVNLGMPNYGSLVSVDDNEFPYNNSRQLFTSQDTSGFGGNHSLMLLDSKTPLDDNGIPIFTPVWEHMLGVGVEDVSVVDSMLEEYYSISPNPVENSISINSQKPINKIELYNQPGKLVREIEVRNTNITIDMTLLKSGIYYLKVYSKNGDVQTEKIVKY